MVKLLNLVPTFPKGIVINLLSILCIVIFAMAFAVVLWKVMPGYVPKPPGDGETGKLYVLVNALSATKPGEALELNVTVQNTATEPFKNVLIEVLESEVLEKKEYRRDIIFAGEKEEYFFTTRVKETALVGTHEETVKVSSGNVTQQVTFKITVE